MQARWRRYQGVKDEAGHDLQDPSGLESRKLLAGPGAEEAA